MTRILAASGIRAFAATFIIVPIWFNWVGNSSCNAINSNIDCVNIFLPANYFFLVLHASVMCKRKNDDTSTISFAAYTELGYWGDAINSVASILGVHSQCIWAKTNFQIWEASMLDNIENLSE